MTVAKTLKLCVLAAVIAVLLLPIALLVAIIGAVAIALVEQTGLAIPVIDPSWMISAGSGIGLVAIAGAILWRRNAWR